MKRSINSPQSWKKTDSYLQDLLTHEWYNYIAHITATIINSTHEFYKQKGINPFVFPMTTGSVSSPMGKGSDSVPIKIKLKGQETYLADSMQFSLELATRLSPKGAYYIMPTFRGEEVDNRHLNEFIHSEVEIPGSFNDIINLAESYIKYLCKEIYLECKDVIYKTAGTTIHLENLLSNKGVFQKIPYREAIKVLEPNKGTLNDIGTDYPNITSSGEKELIKIFGDFLWLIELPYSNVPFYQAKIKNTPYALAGDLLAGIGEILGCGQRVYSNTDLKESLEYHNVDFHGYEWYSQMREIQELQTSGFGMGIERLILWLTNTNDIRDCNILYRDHNKIIYP